MSKINEEVGFASALRAGDADEAGLLEVAANAAIAAGKYLAKLADLAEALDRRGIEHGGFPGEAAIREIDRLRDRLGPVGPGARVTQYEVCALPEDHIDYPMFIITVDYRGKGKWAITRHRRCLGVDGYWDWEPLPSEREDAWLEEHRFELADALELAYGAALRLQVNGQRVADLLRESTAATTAEGTAGGGQPNASDLPGIDHV